VIMENNYGTACMRRNLTVTIEELIGRSALRKNHCNLNLVAQHGSLAATPAVLIVNVH